MNGVILIDKPSGYTSFDVVAVCRKLFATKKVGHTGTLDPNATGVLPVLLGGATKAQDLLTNHDKTYAAQFRLGMTTDTLDIWGTVRTRTPAHVTRQELLQVMERFRGEIEQLPPMYSAVQQNGQRLYDLARKGLEVERERRRVTVYSLTLDAFDSETQSGSLTLHCSKGTYVRTLIDDIGSALGCGAVMTALRRTQACGYSIDRCIPLDDLRALCARGEGESRLLPTESLFADLPQLYVSDAQAKRFSNGGALDLQRTALRGKAPEDGRLFRVCGAQTGFLGLGVVSAEQQLLKIYKLLQ